MKLQKVITYQYQSLQATGLYDAQPLQLSTQTSTACYGRAGANWAVIHVHLLILGTTKCHWAPMNTGVSISETRSQRKDICPTPESEAAKLDGKAKKRA